ncbi:hypothetical protein RHG08_13040 [Clostridioides difficile]|nr:hypothetical protein [Clostridioides difficile]
MQMKAMCVYSELYGRDVSRDEIIDKIRSLDINKALSALRLLFSNLDTQWYLEYIYIKIKNLDENKIRNRVLYSKQGLFYTLKWLMAYSEQLNNNKFELKVLLEDIVDIIDLQIMISDYLEKDNINPMTYIYKNIYFNTQRNYKNEIVRAFEIYVKLASQKEIYNLKEYVDINEGFVSKYNISIKEYIAIEFLLLQFHLTDFKFKTLNLNKFLSKTNKIEEYNKIIRSLGQDMQSYKTWAKETIYDSWDYSEINKYPLIKINYNEYISLDSFTIVNLWFEGLYWKIVDSTSDRKKMIDFLGRPFEKYVELITEDVIKRSALEYEFIPEFKYGKGLCKRSSDAYIRKEKTLFIIECKAGRPKRSTFEKEDKNNIIEAIKKFCITSINQAQNAFNNICNEKKDLNFDKIEEIYIICVSLESVKHTKETVNIIKTELGNVLNERIKGYCNLNIEEYEAFCELLYESRDIKEILDIYMIDMDRNPFINCIYDNVKICIQYNFMNLKFVAVVKEIKEILGM